jgi:hypothetical protein
MKGIPDSQTNVQNINMMDISELIKEEQIKKVKEVK